MKKFFILNLIFLFSILVFCADATPTVLENEKLNVVSSIDFKAIGEHSIYFPSSNIMFAFEITPVSIPSTITILGGDYFAAKDLVLTINSTETLFYFLPPLESIYYKTFENTLKFENAAAFTTLNLYLVQF